MGIKKVSSFKLVIEVENETEEKALEELFDKLDVVPKSYLDTPLAQIDSLKMQLEDAQYRLKYSTPRCSKLQLIKLFVDTLRKYNVSSEQINLLQVKQLVDNIW